MISTTCTCNTDSDKEDYDNITGTLADLIKICAADVGAEDFANGDRKVISVESLDDDEIVHSIINADDPSDGDEEDMEEKQVKITPSEAHDCFQKLESLLRKQRQRLTLFLKQLLKLTTFWGNKLKKIQRLNKQR